MARRAGQRLLMTVRRAGVVERARTTEVHTVSIRLVTETPTLRLPPHRVPFIVAACCTLALVATGCGVAFPQDSPPSTFQTRLRVIAKEAPAGKHAYWLGARIRGSSVVNSSGGWDEQQKKVTVSYNHVTADGSQGLQVDVVTFQDPTAPHDLKAFETDRPVNGQLVRLRFFSPTRPSASLIREIEAAVQPIPANVTYTG
jgi:hypothetical protein